MPGERNLAVRGTSRADDDRGIRRNYSELSARTGQSEEESEKKPRVRITASPAEKRNATPATHLSSNKRALHGSTWGSSPTLAQARGRLRATATTGLRDFPAPVGQLRSLAQPAGERSQGVTISTSVRNRAHYTASRVFVSRLAQPFRHSRKPLAPGAGIR